MASPNITKLLTSLMVCWLGAIWGNWRTLGKFPIPSKKSR